MSTRRITPLHDEDTSHPAVFEQFEQFDEFEIEWDADPAQILEAKEQHEGYNVYGFPIQ